jgi:hypothetical protein
VTEVLAGEVIHEFSVDDPPIHIRAAHIPGDVHQLLVDQSSPAGLEPMEVKSVLYEQARQRGQDPFKRPLGFILSLVDPHNSVEEIVHQSATSGTHLAGLVKGLGYTSNTEVATIDGQTISRRIDTYPSIERANRLMALMQSAGVERTVEFVEYDGDEYTVDEFLEAFINRSQVLIAGEQPYQAHDLSDHLLGWIGLDASIISLLQGRIGPYMERAAAERRLPEVPALPDSGLSRRLQDTLRPSQVVLRRALIGIDALTGDLPEQILSTSLPDDEFEMLAQSLGGKLAMLINLDYGHGFPGEYDLPKGLLGQAPYNLYAGRSILEHYRIAEQVCQAAAGEI